jgi:hypothetical protein
MRVVTLVRALSVSPGAVIIIAEGRIAKGLVNRQEISLLHHLSESDQFITKIIGGKRLG